MNSARLVGELMAAGKDISHCDDDAIDAWQAEHQAAMDHARDPEVIAERQRRKAPPNLKLINSQRRRHGLPPHRLRWDRTERGLRSAPVRGLRSAPVRSRLVVRSPRRRRVAAVASTGLSPPADPEPPHPNSSPLAGRQRPAAHNCVRRCAA